MAKIVGNPTVTPVMPSDWAQKDETKVDYIKNKPTKLSQFENDVKFVDNDTHVTDMQYIDGLLTQNADNISGHKIDYNNPHNVTAEQIGLGNVDNTRDIDKNVAFAISAKMDLLGNVIHEHYATKNEVGNVDLSGYYTAEETDIAISNQLVPLENDIDNIYEEIGDIESVLDSILAIQKTIVGGVNQ